MCKLYKMYINIQSAANMCIHVYIYIYVYTKTEEMCINCQKQQEIQEKPLKSEEILRNMCDFY